MRVGRDKKVVDDELMVRVGYRHCDINPMIANGHFLRLEVDDSSGVELWCWGAGYSVGLS